MQFSQKIGSTVFVTVLGLGAMTILPSHSAAALTCDQVLSIESRTVNELSNLIRQFDTSLKRSQVIANMNREILDLALRPPKFFDGTGLRVDCNQWASRMDFIFQSARNQSDYIAQYERMLLNRLTYMNQAIFYSGAMIPVQPLIDTFGNQVRYDLNLQLPSRPACPN